MLNIGVTIAAEVTAESHYDDLLEEGNTSDAHLGKTFSPAGIAASWESEDLPLCFSISALIINSLAEVHIAGSDLGLSASNVSLSVSLKLLEKLFLLLFSLTLGTLDLAGTLLGFLNSLLNRGGVGVGVLLSKLLGVDDGLLL